MALFEVIKSVSVAKRLFVIAVAAIAIVPRMPFDEAFTIGGNLSRGFRQMILFITMLYGLRNIFMAYIPRDASYFLMATEATLISFLSLLTPYLLRLWMSERINFPGSRQPGMGLLHWVYAFSFLSLVGALLPGLFFDERLWIFKKIADAASFIPVYRTLKIYNRMTTIGGRYPGRGSVLAQAVMTGEYYALFAHTSDIFFKTLDLLRIIQVKDSKFIDGLHVNNHFAVFTRIMLHSIMLNVLDETYHCHTHETSSPQAGNSSNGTASSQEPCSSEEMEVFWGPKV